MKTPAILYLLWGKNLAVLDAFLSRSRQTVLTSRLYASPDLQAVARKYGVGVVALEDLLTPQDEADWMAESARRLERIESALAARNQPVVLIESVELTPGECQEIIGGTLRDQLPAMMQLVQGLEKAQERYTIGLAVVNEDFMALARTVVSWARQRGIPSLHLCHGLNLAEMYTVHGHAEADITAVYGERGLEPYLDIGVPREQLRVTGNPAWDGYPALARQRQAVRAALCTQYGIEPDRPLLVFATTWPSDLTLAQDRDLPTTLLEAVFRAFAQMTSSSRHPKPYLVIKDRPGPAYVQAGQEQAWALAEAMDVAAGDFSYQIVDTERWVVAADVVIACDSNILVEAMLAGVPAVNLLNLNGLRLGPSFDADSGILEVEPENLAESLNRLLDEPTFRDGLLQQMSARAAYYNLGIDGRAAQRVAELMGEMLATPVGEAVAPEARRYVWQSLESGGSAVMDTDAAYHQHVRHELFALFDHPPRRVLDVGCAAGVTGEAIKRQYPLAEVIGIELNPLTLERARERLDRVIEGSIERLDLLACGISLGSLDTVIVADVLEHLYNPWGVLQKLKPFLTPDAQVIASIPNARNLGLLADLAHGHWTYREEGLLDITHIRFFTFAEIQKLFAETGYRITKVDATVSPGFPPVEAGDVVRLGKLRLEGLSEQDLFELKAFQFLVRARPEAVDRVETSSQPSFVQPAAELYATFLSRHSSPYHPADELPADSPAFTFVVPCRAGEAGRLADTLDSLAVQSLALWHLVVVADFPAPDPIWEEVDTLQWCQVESAEAIRAAVAERLQAVETHWLCVVEAGIRFAPEAVEQLVRHALAHPEWRLMYADADRIGADGTRRDPLFRPDFNLDLLRSMPYLGKCLWVEREAFQAAGGLGDLEGAYAYDLVLRVLDAFGEDAIGHVDELLYHVADEQRPLDEAIHKQALKAHLARNGFEARVADGYAPGTWKVEYVWAEKPRVSIIIPTKDQADLLEACVASIRAKTTYPHYEILLVDNGSTQPRAKEYLNSLRATDDRVKVLAYPKPFNFSAMCNVAARAARGEYLLLLNNDTVVLQADWLERLLSYGQRTDVGIVGAKLMFPDTATVQHAGVLMGLGGIAEHPYLGLLPLSEGGYMNRALVDQDLSAVTGACLLVRKSLWDQVKGLDERDFRVSYNDVDLCLKVGERGYKILWTPHVVLLHHGSASQRQEAAHPAKARKAQQRFGNEQQAMLRKWLPRIAHDPAYNRHLSLTHRDFRVEADVVVDWNPRLPSFKTRILGWTQHGGSIDYRIRQPLQALWNAGTVERSFIHPPGLGQTRIPLLSEIARAQPDVLTSVAFLEISDYVETLKEVRSFTDIPFVLHLDDLITAIPQSSEAYERRNTPGELRKVVSLANRVVTTTQPIAEAIRGFAADVQVIPNYLPRYLWEGLSSQRRFGRKPRVGWAGAMQHGGDLALIREVVQATAKEIDWVFFGMCPEELGPYIQEFHPFVPFADYPAKLASLNLDLAVAPLESNRFNECKSNLRLLEYGILGWPVVCSDVFPYRDAPVKRVSDKVEVWLDAIRERVHDLDATEREGDALRAWVQSQWLLEDHLDEWIKAYSFGSRRSPSSNGG